MSLIYLPRLWREDGRWFVMLPNGCMGGSHRLWSAVKNAWEWHKACRREGLR